MRHVIKKIRQHIGYYPQVNPGKIRTFTDPKQKNPVQSVSPPRPVVPSAAETTPSASRPEYQENILLIILLLGGFFLAWDLRVFAVAGIISVIAVYHDAGTLHAGQKFEKESFFGDVVCVAAVDVGSMGAHRIVVFPCGVCLLTSGDFQRKQLTGEARL